MDDGGTDGAHSSHSGPAWANAQDLNARLIAMSNELGWGGRLKTIDLTTLDYNDATLYRDGKHYTYFGAEKAAEIVAAVLLTCITADPLIPAGAAQDIAATVDGRFAANSNTLYAMADGNADGTADSYTAANATGATFARDFVTESGERKQRLKFSGSASTATSADSLTRNVTGLTIPAGEVWEMICAFEIANAANDNDPSGTLGFQATCGSGTAWGATVQASGTGTKLAKMAGVTRLCCTPVVPGSGAASVTNLSMAWAFRHQVGAVDCDVRLGDGWYLRKVLKTGSPAAIAPTDMSITYLRPSDNQSTNFFLKPAIFNSSGTLNVTPGNVINASTISYQWKKDGVNVGANSRSFVPTGSGSYTCDVTYDGVLTITTAALVI